MDRRRVEAYHGTVATESRQPGNSRPHTLRTTRGEIAFGGRCRIMGVVNVTPDSFSDGGAFLDPADAVVRACQMVAEGADIIDIGGESTRPGSEPVSPEEQIRRVVPVIKQARVHGVGVPISIDTQSAAVATAALDAGADIVNDISAAIHDPAMPQLLADRGVPFIIMHMRGRPKTMQYAPAYDDVVAEVLAFFEDRVESLASAGVSEDQLIVDPGIGFGKTLGDNLALLRSVRTFGIRWPVLVGTSRKRFIGTILNEPEPTKRTMGTAATVAHCAIAGVEIVRVHEVREMRQVVDVCEAIRSL